MEFLTKNKVKKLLNCEDDGLFSVERHWFMLYLSYGDFLYGWIRQGVTNTTDVMEFKARLIDYKYNKLVHGLGIQEE